MKNFGLEEWQAGWRAEGTMTLQEVLVLAWELVEFVGMTPDGHPVIDHYPKLGRGGVGIQVYQRLYESWLIISTWPDHGFVRVNLSSCKPFDPYPVERFLESKVGRILARWSYML